MTSPGFFMVDTLSSGLALQAEGFMKSVEEVALQIAPEMLEYAKTNAPWEDRTGDARNGLDIEVDEDGDIVTITLYHTIEYGLWLEVIQAGRFGTIMPTLEHYAHVVFDATGAVQTGEDLSR